MKQIQGKPLSNFSHNIIGKISHKPSRSLKKEDFILVTDDDMPISGYGAVFTTKPSSSMKGTAIVCNADDVVYLKDGDIVSIEPGGNINIVYEKDSIHNALLVTERCNSSCVMCPQFLATKEDDKTPNLLKIISLMDKNTPLLGITGGEPTLIGERLIEILNACKRMLPQTKVVILTNGIRLEYFEYVKRLVMIEHHDLTFDIPLYSDTDTEHNNIVGTNGFYKTIYGLYNLARFNQKIGIRIVMHKLNYNRLPQLAEFIYHNFPFVYHIAFMQMETQGLARENLEKIWIDPYDYNKQLEEAVFYLFRRAMHVSIYNAQLCILPKSLWKFARKSISSWKNIYLDECNECEQKIHCGGFFSSSLDLHSEHIKASKMNKDFP